MDDVSRQKDLLAIWDSSQLAGHNAAYLEDLYEDYLNDPGRVSARWRTFFETLPKVNGHGAEPSHKTIREAFQTITRQPLQERRPVSSVAGTQAHEEKQVRVLQLINAYRFRGHQVANIDPLALREPVDLPELGLAHHGLTESDLDTVFDSGSLVRSDNPTLREILLQLQATYCGSVGAEYMHITETAEKRWIQQRFEGSGGRPQLSARTRRRILEKLVAAEGLERYLHARYVGQKRFSLEGGDSLIPLLDELVQRGGTYGLKEIVIGMAHRGRLNVLVNTVGKTAAELFQEFEGTPGSGPGSGDVKYHQGFSSNLRTEKGLVHLALAFNPSHLEIVGPVVEGSVRARQQRSGDDEGNRVLPVLIHGDAAFAGQGVVMETFNMSQSRGFSTKGTVHVVVNNQIGFTTSHQNDARSTLYCTDIAKMVNAPIFHVNGDDPEAVLHVTRIALDYRMNFHKDVVVDLMCYRRQGHSEADEPTATQPLMYQAIRNHPTPRELYGQKLIADGEMEESLPERMLEDYRARLDSGVSVLDELVAKEQAHYPYAVDWAPYLKQACTAFLETAIPIDRIRQLWRQLERLPEGFELHPNVAKVVENRRKMSAGALPIDWGFAETMAYASLVTEGYGVRLSGQDSGRGTFFHRQAVLHSQKDGELYVPLRNLSEHQGNFLVINSLLSEEAVLAFEYGYATTDPRTLVIWEAQFGDFANNAQVVIDQFISAGEQKWNRLCGLVMFLPHGMEGQGPEHSSARLERYLQLCAEKNMQVCVPTTPAQMFHLLRRQTLLECRKPLIVMTPKSLLRHRLAISTLEDLSAGEFQPLIDEVDPLDVSQVTRVVLCSGKVFYDLLEKRRQEQLTQVAIVRIERLYPFPKVQLQKILARYPQARNVVWCQEEPQNQGAWFSSQHHMRSVMARPNELQYAGRAFSAAPAPGYASVHVRQQHALVAKALGLEFEAG
jgi:2-oxoglutarate dehydrogenase E1 component